MCYLKLPRPDRTMVCLVTLKACLVTIGRTIVCLVVLNACTGKLLHLVSDSTIVTLGTYLIGR